jgi:hypothetical protein
MLAAGAVANAIGDHSSDFASDTEREDLLKLAQAVGSAVSTDPNLSG